MTRTIPFRRITLHFSQIGLTDACTFMGCSLPPPGAYAWRYVIRPRDRSYGESSTVTSSPGRIRM